MTPFVSGLSCTLCGRLLPAADLHTVCPDDGRPLQIEYDLARLRAERPGLSWMKQERMDMWRYGDLLPLSPPRGIPAAGWTPMRPYQGPRADLYLKDEGQPQVGWGRNATESFKDRGIGMAAAMALHFGRQTLSIPTQGNAGDSLVAFARALGQEVYVAMPSSTPAPILQRVRATAEADTGVKLFLSAGTIREAGALLKSKTQGMGAFSVATFAEPGWRIEGKKTMGLEIAEQFGWQLPDVIIYPTGGGTGILGIWKAFQELQALGSVTGALPAMIAVQSSETPPLVRALEEGAEDSRPVSAGDTIATGLNVPYGIGHRRVLEILRESGGDAVAVDEHEMATWMTRDHSLGPEGAACMAVAHRMGAGLAGKRVVVINTCSPRKYLE